MKPRIYTTKPTSVRPKRHIDAYSGALQELFFIHHPHIKGWGGEADQLFAKWLKHSRIKKLWIYYPDSSTLVTTVPEEHYFALRTARNRNLIAPQEQKAYRQLCVGIAGLSVGSAILSALVISGGPQKLKIADFDTLEITNLNRLHASLLDIGQPKCDIAAKKVWLLDPFADIQVFPEGLNVQNIKRFLLGKPRLDVFIDEMDSIEMKIYARRLAKKNRIPVLMATDNGDTVVLDVERFDLEPKRKIFHGLIPNIENINTQGYTYQQWLSLATKIVSPKFLTPKMKLSLMAIGKEIPAVPQLGTTANVAGAAIGFALRKIASRHHLPSGRYVISLEHALKDGYALTARQRVLFKKQFKA